MGGQPPCPAWRLADDSGTRFRGEVSGTLEARNRKGGELITIVVRGTPAPQGSKRHVGHGRMIESSKAVGPWREAVRAETQRAVPQGGMIPGPVEVAILFAMPRPKGHYGTGRNADILKASAPAVPEGSPDVDKLARAVLDGLTQGGAYQDDAKVVDLRAKKVYADTCAPGAVIDIWPWVMGEEGR